VLGSFFAVISVILRFSVMTAGVSRVIIWLVGVPDKVLAEVATIVLAWFEHTLVVGLALLDLVAAKRALELFEMLSFRIQLLLLLLKLLAQTDAHVDIPRIRDNRPHLHPSFFPRQHRQPGVFRYFEVKTTAFLLGFRLQLRQVNFF